MIGTFKTILFVSVFQELLAVTIIVMEGGKTHSSVGISTSEFACCCFNNLQTNESPTSHAVNMLKAVAQ